MSLLENYLELIDKGRAVFSSKVSFIKSTLHSLAEFCPAPRKTITAIIRLLGLQKEDYSSHYKFYSRTKWNPQQLFQPIISQVGSYFSDNYIQIVADYTSIRKSGKHIPNTGWIRDPMSPKFRHNLAWGMTFLQMVVTLPLYTKNDNPSRALPIRWHQLPKMPKPSKKACEEDLRTYELFKKENNRSKIFVEKIQDVRKSFDEAGFQHKKLLISLDGEFCNKRVLNANFDNMSLILRCRKNIKLCFQHIGCGRRFYSKDKFNLKI